MHVPASFREDRSDILHDCIRRNALATIVSSGEQGLPVSQLPLRIRKPSDLETGNPVTGSRFSARPKLVGD